MAGIIPDNFSIDIGQQLMSNIVNLYAQKQQLDEKRKLEDERYKREQEMWEQRQVSTEEREKRMAEYQMNLRLQAETESTINEYKKQNAAKMMDWRQNYLTLISSDENFKQKELQRVGSQEALEKVIQNVQNLTFDQIYKEANNNFNGANELWQSNLYQVEKEKAEKYLEKNPNKKAIMKEVINQGLDPYKISESQIKEIEKQLLPKMELTAGKPTAKSVNELAAKTYLTPEEINELNRFKTTEQWEEAQNYLLGLQSQKETEKEQQKQQFELQKIKEREKLFPTQTRAQTRESEKEADKLSGLQAKLNMARQQLYKDPENTKLKDTIMSLERDIAAITKEAPLTTKTPQAVQPKLSAYLQNLNTTALRDLSSKNKSDKNVILVKGFLNNPEKYDLSSNDKIDELISAFKELKRQELSELFTNRTDLTTYDTIIGELEKLVQQKPYSAFEVKNSN